VNLSKRLTGLDESATLAVTAQADAMRRSGVDVVSFGAGEPDFDTPAHIKAAASRALTDGFTKYAKPTSGIPEARAAVCTKFQRDNGLTYQPDQVIVTVGGKEALFLAFAALLDQGDEVILPVPYWVSFIHQIRLCGGNPVLVSPRDSTDLRLTPEQIAAAITPRTKALVFNSPSNPGGFTYSPAEVRDIASALAGRDIIVLSDEMYDRLCFGSARDYLSFASCSKEWFEKTITFNAASKSHAMTGWRAGFAAGPKHIIAAMGRLQGHTTSGTPTFVQKALVEALTGDQSHVEKMRLEFEKRGRRMHERLNSLIGVRCSQPTGAFYCFPDVSNCYARLGVPNSVEFCKLVLEKTHVAIVPGEAFGMDTHVRLSFATDMASIDKGLDRLEDLLGRA
jgi:aspartate aminotransferase